MEIPAKKGFYSIVLAGYLGLLGCGGGGSVSRPPPSVSQTVSLVNEVDIHYAATLQNVAQATRTITHNGAPTGTTTITFSPYLETLENMEKGEWGFKLTGGNLSDTDTVEVPNYEPTSDFSSLETNLNEIHEGSSKTFNLETLLSDKNPEDTVPLNSAKSLDGKTSVSVDSYNLTITATEAPGAYRVEVNYGSDEGGHGSRVIAGQILAVPDQIAFTSFREDENTGRSNFDIYRINEDGTSEKRLTTHSYPYSAYMPAWSPDGTQIAFIQNHEGNTLTDFSLYVIDADGGNERRVSPDVGIGFHNPVWCSNGRIVVTYINFDLGVSGTARINPDGSGFSSVLEEPFFGNTIGTTSPTCSPDGSEIAFSTLRDGNGEIYVMRADGSNQRNLTNSPFAEFQPSWSPDGSQILFYSDRDDGGNHIYVMSSDGSNVKRLTTSGSNVDAVWSSDGSRIVFIRDFQVWLMNPDGSGLVQLTSPGVEEGDGYPSWRPR